MPYSATGSPYDWGMITYLFLCSQKTELLIRIESFYMVVYRVYDETK